MYPIIPKLDSKWDGKHALRERHAGCQHPEVLGGIDFGFNLDHRIDHTGSFLDCSCTNLQTVTVGT